MASVGGQIQADLAEAIREGRYRPGDRLPGVEELMARYKTRSRGTVGRALEALEAEGLVTVIQGSGVWVRERHLVVRDPVADARREYELAVGGGEPAGSLVGTLIGEADVTVRCRYWWEYDAPRRVRDVLELARGRLTLAREWLFRRGTEPYQLVRSYLPGEVATQLGLRSEADERPGAGTMAHLVAGGLPLGEIVGEIEARMPSRPEREQLKILPGTPVLETWRTLYSRRPDARALEVACAIVPADRVALRWSMTLADAAEPGTES